MGQGANIPIYRGGYGGGKKYIKFGFRNSLKKGGCGGEKKVYKLCVPRFSKEATGSLNRGNPLATIGGERRMEDKHKLLRETEQIKFSEYGLDYCEWGCEKHNINRIWISDSRAVCLQCAVEELGFEVVSDWFNKKLRLLRL
jgi:hypothetical protein